MAEPPLAELIGIRLSTLHAPMVYPQTFYTDLHGLICKAIEESPQNILYGSSELNRPCVVLTYSKRLYREATATKPQHFC
jgi:hypothetical protein